MRKNRYYRPFPPTSLHQPRSVTCGVFASMHLLLTSCLSLSFASKSNYFQMNNLSWQIMDREHFPSRLVYFEPFLFRPTNPITSRTCSKSSNTNRSSRSTNNSNKVILIYIFMIYKSLIAYVLYFSLSLYIHIYSGVFRGIKGGNTIYLSISIYLSPSISLSLPPFSFSLYELWDYGTLYIHWF